MHKEGRWVESSIYYTRRVIWANSNVLWTYQFTGNIPNYDEQTLTRSYQHWEDSELYRWCNNRNRNRGGAWWDSSESSEVVGREQSVCETGEI